MEKICKDCGVEKPLDEFHKHPKMKDGHLNSCKVCRRHYMANRPKERLAEIDRKREQKPARKQFKAEACRKYRKESPEKSKARGAVNYAIGVGKIERQPCQVCGLTEGVHAHHEDYSKPLDVMWLCPIHHTELHQKKKREKSGT